MHSRQFIPCGRFLSRAVEQVSIYGKKMECRLTRSGHEQNLNPVYQCACNSAPPPRRFPLSGSFAFFQVFARSCSYEPCSRGRWGYSRVSEHSFGFGLQSQSQRCLRWDRPNTNVRQNLLGHLSHFVCANGVLSRQMAEARNENRNARKGKSRLAPLCLARDRRNDRGRSRCVRVRTAVG